MSKKRKLQVTEVVETFNIRDLDGLNLDMIVKLFQESVAEHGGDAVLECIGGYQEDTRIVQTREETDYEYNRRQLFKKKKNA
jgi:hypothetical protein